MQLQYIDKWFAVSLALDRKDENLHGAHCLKRNRQQGESTVHRLPKSFQPVLELYAF